LLEKFQGAKGKFNGDVTKKKISQKAGDFLLFA
jgi:hypothetical protein